MEAEKSHDLLSAHWTLRKALRCKSSPNPTARRPRVEVPVQVHRLENQELRCPRAGEDGCLSLRKEQIHSTAIFLFHLYP